MPTVTNQIMTLTTTGSNTDINVRFDALFSPLERALAGMGLRFHHHIKVVGLDGAIETTVAVFPHGNFNVTAGAGPQTISRNVTLAVTRATLQEDPALGDNDELCAKIKIHSVGLPPEFTPEASTVSQVLLG